MTCIDIEKLEKPINSELGTKVAKADQLEKELADQKEFNLETEINNYYDASARIFEYFGCA